MKETVPSLSPITTYLNKVISYGEKLGWFTAVFVFGVGFSAGVAGKTTYDKLTMSEQVQMSRHEAQAHVDAQFESLRADKLQDELTLARQEKLRAAAEREKYKTAYETWKVFGESRDGIAKKYEALQAIDPFKNELSKISVIRWDEAKILFNGEYVFRAFQPSGKKYNDYDGSNNKNEPQCEFELMHKYSLSGQRKVLSVGGSELLYMSGRAVKIFFLGYEAPRICHFDFAV